MLSVLTLMVGSGRWRSPVAWFRLVAAAFSIAFVTLPDIAVSMLPGHHPDDLVDPEWLVTWLRHFDPATGTVPLLDAPSERPAPAPAVRAQGGTDDDHPVPTLP